jgi:hypothetical protein
MNLFAYDPKRTSVKMNVKFESGLLGRGQLAPNGYSTD